jgi:hypothetical protein
MLDRQKGKIVIACDSCGAVFEADSDRWEEAWPEARRIGWMADKIGGDWLHHCPECGRRPR